MRREETTNALLCWGPNDWGPSGVGNTASPNTLVVAAGGTQFRAVMASESATCGVTSNGTAYYWGGNGKGQSCEAGAPPRPLHRRLVSGR